MSTEKNDREVSLTRRTVIKTAAWAIPTILSIGLPVGNVFAHASTGGQTDPAPTNDTPNNGGF